MKYLFLLGCCLTVATPAVAQETNVDPSGGWGEGCCQISATKIPTELITVVGTGAAQRVAESGQSISVVGATEIAAVQGPDLTRVLERLPGVTITRNGGLGNFTGVRIRGADAEQLLVLIDGVRVADVAAPGGGFDFGNLVSGGIGKIELLRGSNSVVWGSQAIGGVLAVTSREIEGVEASAEYGAHDSFDGSAVAGVSGDAYSVTLNGGYTRTDGISTAASGTEPDGFRQWRVGGRGRLDIASGLTATLAGRYADGRLDIDGFPPPSFSVFADTPEYQTSREASGRAGLAYDAGSLNLTGGYALSDTRRAYFDPTFGSAASFATVGRSERADLSGHVDLPADLTLDFGADSEWTRFSTTFDPQQKARLSSGHALLGYHTGALNLAAGVRLDDHSRYGSAWTFGANGSVDLGDDGWRIRASFGEGFKAPTLYQLYGFGGNTALRPEESRSFDLGIERGDRNGALHFALTGFRRDSRNLIDYRFPAGYFNVGQARAEGFEAEADVRPSDRLGLHAAYSYVKATNRVTGKDLARRPRHALTLATDWRTPLHDLTLGADLRLVGDSFDDAGNFVPLDGHSLVTLRASLPVSEQLELYTRVENVGNVSYQTAAGYGTSGRAAYAGMRMRF